MTGSQLLFETFYAAQYPTALKVATLMARDAGNAAEITQEAFFKAFGCPTVPISTRSCRLLVRT